VIELQLIREASTSHGTFGVLVGPGFWCQTIELPWRSNRQKVSCIPAGHYDVTMRKSPRFGYVYWVRNVPGRSWILFHAGNFAGDVAAGLRSHVEGCILLGLARGVLGGQLAVLNSRPAVRKLGQYVGGKPFRLEVMWKS
jgi:hypothetical protein